MKKTFLAKRNTLLTVRGISWGMFALAAALLLAGARFFVPDATFSLLAPVFRASDSAAAVSRGVSNAFADSAARVRQNEILANEKDALAVENAALQKQVDSLTSLLGASGAQKSVAILASVAAHPPENPYDTFLVAAGKQEGVMIGMEAFGPGGAPVGIVSAVSASFSSITLFSAPGVQTRGWIGDKNVPITLSGAGGGVLRAAVARDAAVAVGDPVFVPGPGMLPIGKVARVESDPSSPNITVSIVSATNLFSVSIVALRMTGIVPMTIATSTAL